jgi:hypothetical protein
MSSIGGARRPQQQQRPIRIRKYSFLPTFLVLLAIVSWTSVLIAWMMTSLQRPTLIRRTRGASSVRHKARRQEIIKHDLPLKEIELFPDDLHHDGFFATLKSCLPAESGAKCKQFIPDSGVERIGILRPPGSLGVVFDTFIDDVLKLHQPSKNRTLEIITTSHVPPYGYGKTHGFTKFIRLVTMPLLLAASDLVLDQVTQGFVPSMDDITLEDVTQSLRQVVRWHCRLSHIAAHTAIMTITLEEFLRDPWEQEYEVLVFLDLLQQDVRATNKTMSLHDHMELIHHVDEDKLVGGMYETVHRATNLVTRLDHVIRAGENNHKTIFSNIEDLTYAIVNDELESTNNLKGWPCKSFWDLDDANSKITDMSKRTAKLFAPNCTSLDNNCWVARDLCEAQGDARCVQQKKTL